MSFISPPGSAGAKCALKAVRRLKPEKPTKRLPTRRRWWTMRISKGQLSPPRLTSFRKGNPLPCAFNFSSFFVKCIDDAPIFGRIISNIRTSPSCDPTCRSYVPRPDLFGGKLSDDGERSAFPFIFKIGHALNRSLLYRRYISGGFYFETEKRMEMVAQIKFFSLRATQILSAGPTFKNAIAVTENRKLRAFRRCIDRSILLLMGVPRPGGRRVVLRFENQRNRRRAKD